MDRGPEAPQWPHNQGDTSALDMLQGAADEEFGHASPLEMPGFIAPPDLSDVPRLKNGLIDISVVPPLTRSHVPDLSDELQGRDEKDQPLGYAGLDKNGKLSPYTLPELAQGLQGERGRQGERGGAGDPGPAGREGGVGPQGPPGRSGETGSAGPQGPRGLMPDLTDVLRIPGDPPTLHLNSETLSRDLAYRLAELGLIKLA